MAKNTKKDRKNGYKDLGELRELIINEIGFKAYIAYKLENDMNIWQLDKDAIIDNLK